MKNLIKTYIASLTFVILSIFATQLAAQFPTDNSGNRAPETVNSAVVTVIMDGYTYPTNISTDGIYVAGMLFGGSASYFWSASTGVVQIPGSVSGISDNGTTCGTYSNTVVQYNGSNVETAGTWDHLTLQWTFPGMNPAVPTTFATDYNTGWDITADGSTIVGMQWYPGYAYSAFKWTQAGGYQMIGTGVGQGSRASGISADGSVVFGWAQTASASRTPVIWYNGQVIYINQGQYGEAYGASTSGNYVTGEINNNGFLWSPQNTVFFSNTLNIGIMTPTTVLNDGTVFGYTNTTFPPNPAARRAFARDSSGALMTFNDYAEAKGLENAQQWTFYSINDASADGNKLLGSGKTPEGQNITFIIEFIDDPAVFSITPQSINFGDNPVGIQSPFSELVIRNEGGSILMVNNLVLMGNHVSQFILQDNNTYPISIGQGDSAIVSVAFLPSSAGLKEAFIDINTNLGDFQAPLSGKGVFGVGLNEPRNNTFTVFPNPVTTHVNIAFLSGMESVRLYNSNGQLLLEKLCEGAANVTIDMKNFSKGLYFIQMAGSDGHTRITRTITSDNQ